MPFYNNTKFLNFYKQSFHSKRCFWSHNIYALGDVCGKALLTPGRLNMRKKYLFNMSFIDKKRSRFKEHSVYAWVCTITLDFYFHRLIFYQSFWSNTKLNIHVCLLNAKVKVYSESAFLLNAKNIMFFLNRWTNLFSSIIVYLKIKCYILKIKNQYFCINCSCHSSGKEVGTQIIWRENRLEVRLQQYPDSCVFSSPNWYNRSYSRWILLKFHLSPFWIVERCNVWGTCNEAKEKKLDIILCENSCCGTFLLYFLVKIDRVY